MTNAPIKVRRKNNFNILREARKLGSFDDYPMLRPEVDPQLHFSANSVDQPFYLTGQKDMVLGQISGKARVVFTDGPVRYFDLVPGEYAYIPAGAEHRVLTSEDGIQVRYKAREPGKETVSWKCAACDNGLFSHSFDATEVLAQQGYQEACEAYNGDESRRRCAKCQTAAAPVDLAAFRWQRVAETLMAPEEEDDGEEAGHHHH